MMREPMNPSVNDNCGMLIENNGMPTTPMIPYSFGCYAALLHNRSGHLFPGILKVLWYSRKIRRARILLLGVIPEFRGRGVDALLYDRIWQNSVKHGMPSGEAGWILEDNALMNKSATQLGFRVSKTYRVYDKPL